MGKSGRTNRSEPTELKWIDQFPGCVELFDNAGWLDFFKKIDGYNTEVSYKFGQCYNQDMVAFDTLKFKLTVELVVEAIGVRNEGELWFKKAHLPSMPKGIFYLALFQTGARECSSSILELNG